ncbi:NADAR family protein [Candidatus Saccharibacteria bacterium]|nr:NADAR family protein [Candidatus Saccharibacteria bacterium]
MAVRHLMTDDDTVKIPYYETSGFCLSNFSAHAIKYQGVVYQTAEHAFHAQKFDDTTLREQIINCGSPLMAWELGQKLKSKRRADWDDVKVDILSDILREKVKQYPEVKIALQATGTRKIIEVNEENDFWGCNADGKGQNNMGKILMKIRDELTRGVLR